MVEEMEVKGQRYFKVGQKRPAQDGTKRRRLDATSVSYFRRVGDRLNEGFTEEEEEKALFVENVLSEVKGQAALVSTDMTGSVALERLLSLASPAQVAGVLAELGGETGSEFRGVSCDQCGGHVMESALRQAHRWNEEDSDVTAEDEEHCGTLEAQVKRVCGVVRESLPEFLKDPYGSHVLRTLVQVLSGSLSRDAAAAQTGQKHASQQTERFLLFFCIFFPLKCVFLSCAQFLKIFDELMEGFEAILAAGHMGVVVLMVESCVYWEEKQNALLQRLLQAFHCSEPASLQVSCLPLFLSLLAYEVYYNTETAEGDAVTQPVQRRLSVSYHGSRLVQALAGFKDRSVLMNSLHGLGSADLLTLGTDRFGSHALQKLLTAASDKGRGKILRKLEELYVQLACSSCGSRLLEAVWNSATVSQRQSIAEKLVPSGSQLRSDQFARHIWAKFGLTNFMKRRADWQEVQTGESKKRKMFSDILQ
ncbi:nucleolar protein 9 [Sinocyclocheilus grahami]|uniref:nucleolar protein 9 n=1 Tax=Sinocyclocheilus grahami TaxID=75366 RepID=UPI0007AD18C4|nr:PREDICTED: nucleolar protein 9 [Sinocyclocheilus grahami]